MLRRFLANMPFAAILRGLTPEEAVPVGEALVEAGFAIIEVPLNSPEPFESIERLAARFGERCLIGAGTVTDAEQVRAVGDAGGRLIVMPHADLSVIRAAKSLDLVCAPGVATPTEAFAALKAGADGLKLFPAEMIGPETVRSMRAVLPRETLLLPVGGIVPETIGPYLAAGAAGFGLGSGLYVPGRETDEIRRRAAAYAAAWRAAGVSGT